MKTCNQNIEKTIDLAKIMLELAQSGDEYREDSGCGILFGVLRDSAYKIRLLAINMLRINE